VKFGTQVETILRTLLSQSGEYKRLPPTLKMEAAVHSETWAPAYQLQPLASQKPVTIIRTAKRKSEIVPVVVDGICFLQASSRFRNISSKFDNLLSF
jgi:hypothetical protein